MLEFPSLVLATALPLILYVNNYGWPLFVINNISNFYCILKYGASLEILLYRSFRFRGGSLNLYSTEPIHRFSTDFLWLYILFIIKEKHEVSSFASEDCFPLTSTSYLPSSDYLAVRITTVIIMDQFIGSENLFTWVISHDVKMWFCWLFFREKSWKYVSIVYVKEA